MTRRHACDQVKVMYVTGVQWSRDILTPFLLTVALYHRFCHETKLLLYKITLYSIYFQKSGFEKSANSIGFE